MLAARMLDRSVVIPELLPQDLKLEINRLTQQDAMDAARYLSKIVGIAHARQPDEKCCKAWRDILLRSNSKSLDAPSWLWRSVVDLVGSHELGYLEHCRRYPAIA